ncbi:hypothetical protein PTSG_11832 [Salpingoeca rosetta]|uniref:Uncharacterized protein n=1 Tax=Salpingoeca rosetta (strain ATCC 50818 / BSB-021) TaxID=946362 RepID=F2U2J6_SALR5|nr:uncharacterized protein PTSG_11832 [Salpingoeca rosetta]EGD81351.1 hypothetical protein PTSG_11832 [Salpingoeca rosetta]|eukprot:XP_004996555.1 hypothetical protein PTSG_11832 [Salpingoeca rosetta]
MNDTSSSSPSPFSCPFSFFHLSSAVTTAITTTIDGTTAITLRPTPATIWREADNAHHQQQQQQLLMCGCIVDELALRLSSISIFSSSSSSLGSPTAAAAAMDVEGVMCVYVPLPRMTTLLVVDGGRSLPGPP